MTPGDAMIEAVPRPLRFGSSSSIPTRKRVFDIDQACEYLGVSEDTLQRLVANKRLKHVRVDRRLRFDIRDLDELIDEAKRPQ